MEGGAEAAVARSAGPCALCRAGPPPALPVSRGRWEDLTGPTVAICKADLLDSVSSQGIDSSSPVFANENSDSVCLGIERVEHADLVWSSERLHFKGGIVR